MCCHTDLDITMDDVVVMEMLKAERDLTHVKSGNLLSKHTILVKVELQVTSCHNNVRMYTLLHSKTTYTM